MNGGRALPRDAGPAVIAAGGTGGHVFPAEALAHALDRRGFALALITDGRGAGIATGLSGAERHVLRTRGVAGRGVRGLIGGVFSLFIGSLAARGLLRRLSPRVAIGFGGYPSVPPLLAAARLRVPTVIHEANAVLGRANRLLAPLVDRIATTFAETERLPQRLAAKVVQTGNPVRPEIAAVRDRPYAVPEARGPVRLLVLGGSLGATVMSAVVPEALSRLSEPLRHRLVVTQQCRPEDLDRVRTLYDTHGITAELAPFIADIPDRLAAAHLVICRAGASTLAELTVVGRPAILVPYPHATDDHQAANARALAAAGGGWVMREPDGFTADALAERLVTLIADPALLAEAAAKARAWGRVDAAERLADLVEELAPTPRSPAEISSGVAA